MGCDIHFLIERQREDGTWENLPYAVQPWVALDQAESKYNRDQWVAHTAALQAGLLDMPRRFRARNYDLFGIIGDVRNGTGFAGVVTGEAWPSIAPNRGFPSDATRKEDTDCPDEDDEFVWQGDHSFTWVSLEELEAFPWDTCRHQSRGILDFDVWQRWKAGGSQNPETWSGGVSGRGVEIISEPQALVRKDNIHEQLHVECWWGETARQATDDWAGDVLPVLRRAAQGRPLRLLVGFDS